MVPSTMQQRCSMSDSSSWHCQALCSPHSGGLQTGAVAQEYAGNSHSRNDRGCTRCAGRSGDSEHLDTAHDTSRGVTASRSVSGILYRRPLRIAGGDHPSWRSTEGCLAASGPLIPSVRSCFECRATGRRRRRPWCALTAPFHPCLIATEVAPSAVCSLLHGMSGSPDLARASTLSCEVPTSSTARKARNCGHPTDPPSDSMLRALRAIDI